MPVGDNCPPGFDYGVALLDRLTKTALQWPSNDADLHPQKLKENFGVALYELHLLKSKLEQRSFQLEAKCREDERTFRLTLDQLRATLSELHDQFIKLDTQVHLVSGKLIHLGEQLERKNLPRKRIEEARDLILEFYKFLGAGGGTFANVAVNLQGDEAQLLEAATRIKSLSSLCLELPDDERFLPAKQRVTVAQQQLESTLLERFRLSYLKRDTHMMKQISDVLVNSKSHSMCTDILVEEVLKGFDTRRLDFQEITKRLVSAEKDIMNMLSRPESVLLQLIHSMVTNLLKPHMDSRIKPGADADTFLTNLYTEYQNMDRLVKELSNELTLITDPSQLSKLFTVLFSDYLKIYMRRERECLTKQLTKHLAQFYESRGHHKRALQTSGLADLKRDLKVKLHISLDGRSANDYEVSLLSEEVAVNIIEDVRRAAKRCLLLSQPSELAENGKILFSCLYKFLIVEHVDYGVTLALHGLQLTDPKNVSPNPIFLTVVHDASSILQFFEKTMDESIIPIVSTSSVHLQELNTKRQTIHQELESKLQNGLDRCLNLIISHVQHLLSTEQRKMDFRPEAPGTAVSSAMANASPPSQACQKVIAFLTKVIREAKQQLDGGNLKNFLSEFGMRVNRALVDHLYGFTYSDTGGFIAMQEVTAYREVAKQFENPAVNCLFDILLKLVNLMLIKPENVKQVIQDYLQSGIPSEILHNFIQLRADYKSAKVQMDLHERSLF
ncbi:unnamed protein product [Dicrocoelium dendriticum]|nr:unnamed protein product [Dicrocoelium dendriticum]